MSHMITMSYINGASGVVSDMCGELSRTVTDGLYAPAVHKSVVLCKSVVNTAAAPPSLAPGSVFQFFSAASSGASGSVLF